MKKYEYLVKNQYTQAGDETIEKGKWRELFASEWGMLVTDRNVAEFRRLVPHTGDVQFLMCVSILVPVIVNCDGREQESIEAEAGELAYQKVLDDPRKYISYENVDWKSCKVDEIQPEPKNPGKYRHLDEGERTQTGDEILLNHKWTSAGLHVYVDQYHADEQLIRRPITETQYRPFTNFEVIEDGDQVLSGGVEWVKFEELAIGQLINPYLVEKGTVRKLIK